MVNHFSLKSPVAISRCCVLDNMEHSKSSKMMMMMIFTDKEVKMLLYEVEQNKNDLCATFMMSLV